MRCGFQSGHHGKINRYKPKTDSYYQTENNTGPSDNGHVFGVIGTDGLKQTPETVADVNCHYNHCQDIYAYISGVCKCIGNDLINRCIALVDKVKVSQVKNDKSQN